MLNAESHFPAPLLKVAIVGPESTGKSSIAESLARHFDTIAVPEYSREYCKGLDRNYTLQDELNMFYGQLALERSVLPLAQNQLVFCDTTILTVKVWCDHLFGFTPDVVIKGIQNVPYDLYLLMDIDLPWQDDPLRDFPDLREHFMKIWVGELEALNANYVIINGLGEKRLANAISEVHRFLTIRGR
jgi:NadR type nicotinamide-nucleotide adenylyltransferase